MADYWITVYSKIRRNMTSWPVTNVDLLVVISVRQIHLELVKTTF